MMKRKTKNHKYACEVAYLRVIRSKFCGRIVYVGTKSSINNQISNCII